jgi:8-oxo-dGTP pyrophosphatase MutT (NUDIX family)
VPNGTNRPDANARGVVYAIATNGCDTRLVQWKVNSERSLYRDQWVDVRSADVELPDGRRVDHRLIHTFASAGAVVVNGGGRVLLLWRHRFITNSWGYEIPLGRIVPGEAPVETAARTVEEKTGWSPGALSALLYVQPSAGLTTSQHHIFHATQATYVGPAVDGYASEHIEWVRLDTIHDLIGKGQIVSGTTVAALLLALTRT